MMPLAAPTPEVLGILAGYPEGVCEIGAGDGAWLQAMRAVGIDCAGYDIFPQDASVRGGTVEDAVADFPEAVMLAVWPPGGTVVQDWIRAWQGERVALVYGGPVRARLGDVLLAWQEEHRLYMPPGRKGGNVFVVWRRFAR